MIESSAKYEGNHRAFIPQEIAFPQVALEASSSTQGVHIK